MAGDVAAVIGAAMAFFLIGIAAGMAAIAAAGVRHTRSALRSGQLTGRDGDTPRIQRRDG